MVFRVSILSSVICYKALALLKENVVKPPEDDVTSFSVFARCQYTEDRCDIDTLALRTGIPVMRTTSMFPERSGYAQYQSGVRREFEFGP